VPFPLDGEQTVLEGDLEIVDLDAGELDHDDVGVLALRDIYRRCPGRGAGRTDAGLRSVLTERLGKHLVHLAYPVLRTAQIVEGIPARHHHRHLDSFVRRAGGSDERGSQLERRVFTCRATMFTVS
jgi:hypothetical protein